MRVAQRRLRIVEISEEVECSEWPKRRLLQTIRDMRAERGETTETEEEVYMEMKPEVEHGPI